MTNNDFKKIMQNEIDGLLCLAKSNKERAEKFSFHDVKCFYKGKAEGFEDAARIVKDLIDCIED